MKTIKKSIFTTAAITILCFALSFIISCKSSSHSDEEMADTTGTAAMEKMKADSIRAADSLNALNAVNTVKPVNKLPKKGVAKVIEPIPEPVEEIAVDKNKVYNHAEVPPVFPGGQSALDDYIKDNIKYPSRAMENGTEGKVVIQFIVDENGKVSGTTVQSKPLGYGIEEEAMRVVNEMPLWTPGKIKGKNVKTYRVLPIVFALE